MRFIFFLTLVFAPIVHAGTIAYEKAIIEIDLSGIKRIYFSGSGIPKPTINYTKSLKKEVFVESVADSAHGAKSLLGFEIAKEDTNISFGRPTHTYSCELVKKNGKVIFVKGACFNQIVFSLPVNTRLEIYSQGKRITPIFYAVTYNELMNQFKHVPYDENRHAIVDEFLSSYQTTETELHLKSFELQTILEQYIFMPSRLEGLKKLHKYLEDRGNLERMINAVFIYPSDRREARKIVGL